MTASVAIALLFIALAVVIKSGKGDWLIAGYNTASEKERQQIDIGRLRTVMAVMMLVTAAFCILLFYIGENKSTVLICTAAFLLISFLCIVIANTWTKKK